MFDRFFGTGQKFAYDVASTLGRAASMLLMRGIHISPGSHPMTDGQNIITLPMAMKRWLEWDEIDFVRYLLHHEAAHIKFSPPPEQTYSRLRFSILNALEDIRIEAKDQRSMPGSWSIYETGHRITLRMWDQMLDSIPDDKDVTVEQGIVHSISVTHMDRSRRGVSVSPMIDFMHQILETNGVYAKIDSIDSSTDFRFVKRLADEIYDLLNPEEENCGTPQDSGVPKEIHDAAEDSPPGEGFYGGGLVEMCSKTLDADEGEERVNVREISQHGNGLSLGYNYANSMENIDTSAAKENYEWGKCAAAAAGHVINLLRGQSRAKWSGPRDSGLRIAQRRVPDFIRGLTNNVLKRRSSTPHIGTSVFLMVDDSSSMYGSYDRPAWRAASMLGHACARAQLRLMIARFSDSVGIEKYWHTPIQKLQERFALSMGGSTDAEEALRVSHAYLKMERSQRRVLFFITDGATGYGTRKVCREITDDGIELYPILLGECAGRQSMRGNAWDFPTTSVILDPSNALASSILRSLSNTIQ